MFFGIISQKQAFSLELFRSPATVKGNLFWFLFDDFERLRFGLDPLKLMEISCPSCDEAVLIVDENIGGNLECPFCQQLIEFEEPES